jgi:transglutaminase-like putative cysteine protease
MSPEQAAGFRRLAWTTGGLVAALGPHLLRLKPWVSGFVLAACAWRLLAERRGWRLPPPLLRGMIAGTVTAGVFLSYSTITGLDGGTALLALMSALKLLEARNARDQTVLIFIGWFLCLASFLYAQDVRTAAWVLPTVWLLAAALLVVSRRGEDGPPLRPFRTTGAMLLKGRADRAHPVFVFPAPCRWILGRAFERARGDRLDGGDVARRHLGPDAERRRRFPRTVRRRAPAARDRYWRGLVFSQFDGYTWSRGDVQAFYREPTTRLDSPIDYTVTLEPTGQQMLFALDMVDRWTPGIARQSWDFSLRAAKPVNAVLRYEARSFPRYRAGEQITAGLRNLNLRLPPGRNPRTLELAGILRASAQSDAEYIQAVLDLFRKQSFYYTLSPPGLARDSVDDFLFNTRRGFCGHFASAFTTLMRAAGIPARVVGGYQGGDWNPVGGYLIVRQSHAHAWSEVWLPGPRLVARRSHRGRGARPHRARHRGIGGRVGAPRARADVQFGVRLAGADALGQPERRMERLGRAVRPRDAG